MKVMIDFAEGAGNVYADLDMSDAEEMIANAYIEIGEIIKAA